MAQCAFDSNTPISIVGVQRSGTNYFETFLLRNEFGKFVAAPFWKHAFPGEVEASLLAASNVALLVRHPVMWWQSCITNYSADLFETRSDFLSYEDLDGGYAALYNKFYGEWLRKMPELCGISLKYEDLIAGKYEKIKNIMGQYRGNNSKFDEMSNKINKVRNSIDFFEEDIASTIRFECGMDPDRTRDFLSRIDPSILSYFGYDADVVKFKNIASIRSISYKLLRGPQLISRDDYQRLKDVSGSRFANNFEVLHALGIRASVDGCAAEALDFHAMALKATENVSRDNVQYTEGLVYKIYALDCIFSLRKWRPFNSECSFERSDEEYLFIKYYSDTLKEIENVLFPSMIYGAIGEDRETLDGRERIEPRFC